MTYIYGLYDPRIWPTIWRYVGKTVRGPSIRLREHEYYSGKIRTPVSMWVLSLLRVEVEPVVKVLERVPDSGDWEAAERKWIMIFREMGYPLLNLTNGGDGTQGYKLSPEAIEHLRRPKSELHKKRIGDGNRGTKRPDMRGATHPVNRLRREDPEGYRRLCRSISEGKKGRPNPAISESNRRRKGEKRSAEACKNLSKGIKEACKRRGHQAIALAAQMGHLTRWAKKGHWIDVAG